MRDFVSKLCPPIHSLAPHRLWAYYGVGIFDKWTPLISTSENSRNDDPRNGLTLSKNAHWMFDEGLWSLTDDLKVLVAEKAFTDWSGDGFSLRNYHTRPLIFGQGCTLRPDTKYIAWHRQHRFQGQE